MQLCVNVQLGTKSGGAEGEAIYIDTEGSFSVERVAEMAAARVERDCPTSNPQDQEDNVSAILTNIRVYRVHDHIEQIALLHQLETVVQENPKIKLIVLDSIAFHFRQGFGDMGLRSRLLSTSAQILRKLAGTYSICVLVVNQMATKVVKVGNQDVSTLVPALGDSWGHACTNRVVLFWRQGVRQAMLVKSPNYPENTASYTIVTGGILDVEQYER
ncbi:DNA repair protein rad51-like protein 3, r51h3,putative [Obelidium mucronatum]|nr:DNA repair protein rad51-like protein 3, r51h3,putative [Obelidium mucronatum]